MATDPGQHSVTEPASAHIFHLALARDWAAAEAAGDYRVSTIGRSLAQEGFLHAAYADQVDGVRQRYYADVTEPLLLLEIDPSVLNVPLVVETPKGGPGRPFRTSTAHCR